MDSDPIPALRNLDSALASAGPVPAPGARVVIRHAEWVIRRVDRSPDGGYQLVCDGVSELVREREAIFLTTIESDIQVLDPADTGSCRTEKALFSSPAACIVSVDQRLRRREREPADPPNAPVAAEVESLQALRQALETIGPDYYAKYQALLAAVRGGKPFDWNGNDPQDHAGRNRRRRAGGPLRRPAEPVGQRGRRPPGAVSRHP